MIAENSKKEIKELESYLQDMWLFSPIPLAYLNPLGVILDIDSSLAALLALTKEEVRGKSLSDFFCSKEIALSIQHETLSKGALKNLEACVKTAAGQEIPVNVFTMIRKDQRGKPVGFFLALTDLSDLKKIQKELEEKVVELKEFHDLAVGRELKMIELKQEVNALLKKSKQKPKYIL